MPTIGYNALSQQTAIARYQSTGTTNAVASTAFTYDTINRIDTLTHKQGATTLDSYDYDFDKMSRITSVNNATDGVASYTYDKTSQVTAADNPSPQTDEAYSYDANGNRTSTGYTINTNNQTTASPGYTYTYDDEGNRTKRTETATGHVEEYSYDYRNRLTAVKFRNTAMGSVVKEVDYAYDYQNRMVKRTYDADGAGAGSPTNQYWVYDDSINAVLQFDGASASNLSHRYLWANDVDALLSDEQVTSLGSGGNTLWALSDDQGSVRDIADLNEGTGVTSITNHRTYNSFGKLTSETNSAVDLVFGYTDKYLDDATGYQNNVNRWYDSNLGQWFNEDPKGFDAGDENLRRYVSNNSLNKSDSLGLDEAEDAWNRWREVYLREWRDNSIRFFSNGTAQFNMSSEHLVSHMTFTSLGRTSVELEYIATEKLRFTAAAGAGPAETKLGLKYELSQELTFSAQAKANGPVELGVEYSRGQLFAEARFNGNGLLETNAQYLVASRLGLNFSSKDANMAAGAMYLGRRAIFSAGVNYGGIIPFAGQANAEADKQEQESKARLGAYGEVAVPY